LKFKADNINQGFREGISTFQRVYREQLKISFKELTRSKSKQIS